MLTHKTPLHGRLREMADWVEASFGEGAADVLRAAAAEIEGHNEAFSTVVNDKNGLKRELEHAQRNHRATLDLLARWRELLVELARERPDDIRITRALAGEHPLRPAPWERKC